MPESKTAEQSSIVSSNNINIGAAPAIEEGIIKREGYTVNLNAPAKREAKYLPNGAVDPEQDGGAFDEICDMYLAAKNKSLSKSRFGGDDDDGGDKAEIEKGWRDLVQSLEKCLKDILSPKGIFVGHVGRDPISCNLVVYASDRDNRQYEASLDFIEYSRAELKDNTFQVLLDMLVTAILEEKEKYFRRVNALIAEID